jgi:hypothetical protein
VVTDGFTTVVFAGARLLKIESRDSLDRDGFMVGGHECDEESSANAV